MPDENESREVLADSDAGMGRILEDLIEMLHRRGLINRDDLPPEALARSALGETSLRGLERRAELRRQVRGAEKPPEPALPLYPPPPGYHRP